MFPSSRVSPEPLLPVTDAPGANGGISAVAGHHHEHPSEHAAESAPQGNHHQPGSTVADVEAPRARQVAIDETPQCADGFVGRSVFNTTDEHRPVSMDQVDEKRLRAFETAGDRHSGGRQAALDQQVGDDYNDEFDDELDLGTNLIFDHLDMNGDQHVVPKEVAAFIDRFLWSYREPVRDEMTAEVVKQAERALATGNEGLPPGLQRSSMLPEDMPVLARNIFTSEKVFSTLYRSSLLTNTLLLRQFLTMDYEKEAKVFSLQGWIFAWLWLQILPITLLLPHMHLGKGRMSTALQNVRQLLLQTMWRLITKFGPRDYEPWLDEDQDDLNEDSMTSAPSRRLLRSKQSRTKVNLAKARPQDELDKEKTKQLQMKKAKARFDGWLERFLPFVATCLTSMLYINVYFCLLTWWIMYGPSLGRSHVDTFSGFTTLLDPRDEVGFFEAHMPFFILQVLICMSATKVAIRGGRRVQQFAATVHDMGQLETNIRGVHRAIPPGNAERWTIGGILQRMQEETDRLAHRSKLKKTIRILTVAIPVVLLVIDRLTRLALVGTMFPRDKPWALLVTILAIVSLVVLIQLWYSEYCELMEFLMYQLIRARVYSRLFSRHQAHISNLPCMKNYWSENIVHWARIRAYVQTPNVIEMCWLELTLFLILILTVAYTILFVVALFGANLLKKRPDQRTGDTQAGMLFLMLLFFFMASFAIYMILTAVRIGDLYNNDLRRLHREIFDTVCRLHFAGRQPMPKCPCAEQQLVSDVLLHKPKAVTLSASMNEDDVIRTSSGRLGSMVSRNHTITTISQGYPSIVQIMPQGYSPLMRQRHSGGRENTVCNNSPTLIVRAQPGAPGQLMNANGGGILNQSLPGAVTGRHASGGSLNQSLPGAPSRHAGGGLPAHKLTDAKLPMSTFASRLAVSTKSIDSDGVSDPATTLDTVLDTSIEQQSGLQQSSSGDDQKIRTSADLLASSSSPHQDTPSLLNAATPPSSAVRDFLTSTQDTPSLLNSAKLKPAVAVRTLPAETPSGKKRPPLVPVTAYHALPTLRCASGKAFNMFSVRNNQWPASPGPELLSRVSKDSAPETVTRASDGHQCLVNEELPMLADLQEYIDVMKELARMLANSCEYITVMGLPIDAKFRTAIVSTLGAVAVAVLSTLVGTILKQAQEA